MWLLGRDCNVVSESMDVGVLEQERGGKYRTLPCYGSNRNDNTGYCRKNKQIINRPKQATG